MASHGSSLEMNKIAGAILVGGMITLISGILADALVAPKPVEHAAVAVPEGETVATVTAPSLEPVGPLLASADTAAGQEVAKRCATCHTFEQGGPAKIGPNLWNVVGAKHGHMEGFAYSTALRGKEGIWTYEDLNAFIASPRAYAPGTKMSFAGLKKVADRANVIAWLRTLSDSPQPLPDPSAAAPAATPTEATAEGTAPEQAGGSTATTGAGTAGGAAATVAETAGSAEAPEAASGTEAGGAATQQAAAGGSLASLLAGADLAAGEKIARRCVTCHTFDKDGANKIGPNLWNIVGAPHAHRDDYQYSPAMRAAEGAWTFEALDAYLDAPRQVVPGTKMTFAGLKDPKQRADLIAWLRTLSDNPPPLP